MQNLAKPDTSKAVEPKKFEPKAVTKKITASILNHMIRVFETPSANVITKVCVAPEDVAYIFEEATISYRISTSSTKFKDFEDRMTKLWKTIQDKKVPKYKYKMEFSNYEKDHVLEVQHIVDILT